MPRQVPPDLTLDALKKEAKRWLKGIRANDAAARARFARALPDVSTSPTLQEVARARARVRPRLDDLKRTLAEQAGTAGAGLSFDDAVLRFLDNVSGHHMPADQIARRARRCDCWSDIRKSPPRAYTAVVCGNLV
jgi:hypothetical protein